MQFYWLKKSQILKEIRREQIVKAEYYKIYNLLFGDPKGGYLTIYYNDNSRLEQMKLSISFRMVNKIPIRGLVIKSTIFKL